MDRDTDVLDQDQDLDVQEGQDAPITSLPDHAAGEKAQTRQEQIDQALSEGTDEAVIDELATKEGDVTLEDLKRLPGAEGLTDEQIKAEWNAAVQAVASGEEVEEGEVKLPFPVYDKEGNKVAPDQVTIAGLLSGELQIGYNALGKEQRKTLTEALRNASMGHWNEQKYNLTVQERNQVAQELAELKRQAGQFSTERKTWDAALTALSMGNIAPMKALAEAYQRAMTKGPDVVPEGMMSAEQVRAEQEEAAQGQQYIMNTIIPAGLDVAQRYGADPKEVLNAIEFFLKREVDSGFLTQEKIDAVIQYEVPQLLEANGYAATEAAKGSTSQPANEVAELKKTVAALQARIAGNENQKTEKLRTRKAPPQGGGATPGAGDSMPSFKSRAQMKAWMAGDTEWQKA